MLVVHSSLCVYATADNFLVKRTVRAAVLISDYAATRHDYWASPLAFLGAYPYWTAYFNNRGMQVRWFLHAKSTDLYKVVRDESFQSIVLVGHGSLNSWQAVDVLVTNVEVASLMQGMPKKNGEWIQLTCAVKDKWPLKMGELVMAPSNVYTYHDEVNTWYFVADAFSGFKLIRFRADFTSGA